MLPWKHQVVYIELWPILMTFAYVLQRFMPFIHKESANSNIDCQHLQVKLLLSNRMVMATYPIKLFTLE